MTQPNRFKIVLVGDAKVGKTAFVNRHLTGDFKEDYDKTLGVDIHPLRFATTYGDVIFDIWDVGQEGLHDAYYTQANAVILFFDVQNKKSYDNLGSWLEAVKRVAGDIPAVVCGNKTDLPDRVVSPKKITFHRKNNAMYYDISAKSNYNYEKPFLHLARQLLNQPNLELTVQ